MQCSEEICLKHLKLEMQHKFATVFFCVSLCVGLASLLVFKHIHGEHVLEEATRGCGHRPPIRGHGTRHI